MSCPSSPAAARAEGGHPRAGRALRRPAVRQCGRARQEVRDDAVRRLQTRPWPGNIRELRNAVERVLILASGKKVTAEDIDHCCPAPWAPRREPARRLQARSGKEIPGSAVPRARLEPFGDSPSHQNSALQSLQENGTIWSEPGAPNDASSQETGIESSPTSTGAANSGLRAAGALRAAAGTSIGAAGTPVPAPRRCRGAYVALDLWLGELAVGSLFWPYDKACGIRLIFFLGRRRALPGCSGRWELDPPPGGGDAGLPAGLPGPASSARARCCRVPATPGNGPGPVRPSPRPAPRHPAPSGAQ